MGLPWIKLAVDLPDMGKLVALAAALGRDVDSALGLVVRLWTWTARTAPTGRVTARSVPTDVHGASVGLSADCPQDMKRSSAMVSAAAMIEYGCRWTGPAGVLVAALVSSRLLDAIEDGYCIHDWEDHAGALAEKAERDHERKRKDRERKAASRAAARAAQSAPASTDCPQDILGQSAPVRALEGEGDGERDLSPSERGGVDVPPSAVADPTAPDRTSEPAAPAKPSGPTVEDLRELWNAEAHASLPRWRETSPTRRKHAQARLRERPIDGADGWREVIRRINASDFCRGTNDRGWRADADWLLRPDSATRVLEGRYDGSSGPRRAAPLHLTWEDNAKLTEEYIRVSP